jgi:APA family basic amino acid/polyamine antiporter
VPLVPILGIVISFALMASLPIDTWWRLIIWLAIGMVIYFGYGRHHSRVQRTVPDAVKAGGD